MNNGKLSKLDVARICHEANRAFCEELLDYTHDPWESAPRWQQETIFAGVKAHLDDPSLTPQGSHELWMACKRDEGWTYGPVKDSDLKKHPCMVPFDQLPLDQQRKDYLIANIVEAMRPLVAGS